MKSDHPGSSSILPRAGQSEHVAAWLVYVPMQPGFDLIRSGYNIQHRNPEAIRGTAFLLYVACHSPLICTNPMNIFSKIRSKTQYLVISKEGYIAGVGDSEDLPVAEQGRPRLQQNKYFLDGTQIFFG